MNEQQAQNLLGITSPVAVLGSLIEVYGEAQAVKYGEGKDSYEGYKHEVAILTGARHQPTSDLHAPKPMRLGIYNLCVEVLGKGKIKTKNHYVFNEQETAKLLKSN